MNQIKHGFTGILIILCGAVLHSFLFAQASEWEVTPGFVVEQVASDLHLPVNIAFMPNPRFDSGAPHFYVSELYGSIKVVLRNGDVLSYASDLLNFNPTGSFPGSGETGLIGLSVDSNGDLTATTAFQDAQFGFKNRVIHIFSDSSGHGSVDTLILKDQIPGAGFAIYPSHQIQACHFGLDGKLYVQIGDGFDTPATAQDINDLRGKVLRMNPDGSLPADNPIPGSYVYALGFRNPFGGAWRREDGLLYVSDNGTNEKDRLVKVAPGSNAGWPNNLDDGAIKQWTPTIGVTAIDFCYSAAFPQDFQGRLFAASAGPTYHLGTTDRGKRIEMFQLDQAGNIIGEQIFLQYIGAGRATVVGLAFSDEGLFFTDLYGEAGFDNNGVTHANVYRVYFDSAVSVTPPGDNIPQTIFLAQNYPNPFNPTTTIEFQLPRPATVTLKIFDAGGREIETILQKSLAAGNHAVKWDGAARASGIYFYQLQADNILKTRKLLLLR